MVKSVFFDVFKDIWPMLIIILVIVCSLRITYLITKHKRFQVHKELIYLISIIYILCLFHVVTFQDNNYGVSNFIPFKEIFRYSFGSEKFIKNILGNIMLFIPYGFLSSYLLKNKKISVITILTIVVSLTIETVQYYIGRVFDIDDIILNLLGGIIGFLIFIGIDAIRSKVKILRNDTVLDILIIIILAIVIVYSFNINIFGMIGG
ncbi:MAG: VanZ family protein [Bacilli bacterium]|nr:VanZ family protein [Bacilli bacterium]